MASKPFLILRGSELVSALQKTSTPIRLVSHLAESDFIQIPPDLALFLVNHGVFFGAVRRGRVHYIRNEAVDKMPEIDMHYWDDRACLRFWPMQTSPASVLITPGTVTPSA